MLGAAIPSPDLHDDEILWSILFPVSHLNSSRLSQTATQEISCCHPARWLATNHQQISFSKVSTCLIRSILWLSISCDIKLIVQCKIPIRPTQLLQSVGLGA